MYRYVFVLLWALSALLTVEAQNTVAEVLQSVERNNPDLAVGQYRAEVQSVEARVGNSLSDPTVSYDHLWGSPAELGKTGELVVSQSFDFPTSYVARNRLADSRAEQFARQYSTLRQQVLLAAEELCVEWQFLQQIEQVAIWRADAARRVTDIITRRLAVGDATALDAGKADFEMRSAARELTRIRIRKSEIERQLQYMNAGEPVHLTTQISERGPAESLADMIERYKESDVRIRESEASVEAAANELSLSRSQSLPSFDLGYKREYALGERFNGITMGMSIPIFANRHNVRRARAQQVLAQSERLSVVQSVVSSLSELYARYEALTELIGESTQSGVDEKYLSLLQEALRSGQISAADYFTDLQSCLDAVSSMWESRLERCITAARINSIFL